MQFLWTLFNVLIGVLSFLASALMLKRLWRLVPLSVRSLVRNGLAMIFFLFGIFGSIMPVMPGFVFLLLGVLVMDVPQKRVALRRLQHSWLIQKLMKNRSFVQTWRSLRRFARHTTGSHYDVHKTRDGL